VKARTEVKRVREEKGKETTRVEERREGEGITSGTGDNAKASAG
jgi:hypothetical protein